MVILGTNIEFEYNFELYVKALQKIHGDEYVYYYKGHPRYPSSFFEGRKDYLDALNLYELESTIPAELLFFFNPDAYCTGYQSTTYQSLNVEQVISVFNKTFTSINAEIEASTANSSEIKLSYYTKEDNQLKLDYVINLTPATDEKYGLLVTSDKCAVIEYANTTNYDISIYDLNTDSLKHYKYNNDTHAYEEVL